MTTTNDLLDRMAEALRCWRQFPFTADKIEITDAALAEYDRLRASPSQEKAGGNEVAAYSRKDGSRDRAALEPGGVECQKCGCIFIGEEWHSVCRVCFDGAVAATITHPTPEADAVAPVAKLWRSIAKEARREHDAGDGHFSTEEVELLEQTARAHPAPTVATREAVSDAFGYISAENASWLLAGSYRECVVYSYRRDDSDIQLCYAAPGTTRVSETPYCWAPKEGTGHMPTIDCETVRSFETRHFCVPLHLRPASSAIPAAMVTDEIIGAVLNAGHIWDMSMDSARATRGDRLDFIKSSVKRAIAAPPTDRAGDEG